MVALQFTAHSAAQPDQAYPISPSRAVKVDVSSMFEDVFAEGDTSLSSWWRDVVTAVKVRTTTFSFFSHGE